MRDSELMGSSDSFSLFDPSSHYSGKPSKDKKKGKKVLFKLNPEQRKLNRQKLNKDPEIKEWLGKIESYHKELDEKIHALMEKEGHSPQSLRRYLNDPNNFSEEQKKLIEKEKAELDKTLGSKLDPSLKKLRKKTEAQKAGKKRRGKTLGARKNWMDMH